MYNGIIVSSLIKEVGTLDVKQFSYGTIFWSANRTVIVYQVKAEFPLCVDIWNERLPEGQKPREPDREIELDRPLPAEQVRLLIALQFLNATDIRDVDVRDIADSAVTLGFRLEGEQ